MAAVASSVKEWKCPKGHVMGVVRRVESELHGRRFHVSKLYLYRHAVDMTVEQPREVDVIGPVEGSGGPFVCDVPGCGCSRRWEIGEDAMERLLEKMTGGNHGN